MAVVIAAGGAVGGRELLAADEDARPQAGAADAEAQRDDADGEGGIGFPGDRLRERQLDRARRLVADQRWSDAATLLDEILSADRDAFFRVDRQQRTWQSIKSEAGRLVGSLDKPGRDAYELQFRARADRLLEQAIATNDSAGIVAVARRWFHTPAGQRATLLAAIESLEMNQPLAAAVWLDRLAGDAASAAFEPTLSVMRAIAWLRAGDRTTAAAIVEKAGKAGRTIARLAGRDTNVTFPPGGGLAWLTALVGESKSGVGGLAGDWPMHRGDAARNGIADASCPLLVPRYRVPLARHPEESRLLEARRRAAADQELAILPAGTPLAVDGTVLVHTTMGLLAVDFETGKRMWLQTGGGAGAATIAGGDVEGAAERGDAEGEGSFSSVFEDATSGTLSSDGRLVFAVESHPGAVSSGGSHTRQAIQALGGLHLAGGWRGGNTLAAYDLAARGALRWRLPVRDDAGRPAAGGAAAGAAWFLGAPLPAGDQVYVLVEEKGEIRLDVLDAATGRVAWSQPLAEVDEDRAIDNRDSHSRRLAGLSPALSEGVLVCPTGAGAVVAVDAATRTLLWAHDYPQATQGDVVVLPNGIRMRRGNVAVGGRLPGNVVMGREQAGGRWLDSTPILHDGRVLLTPVESQELHCLDLRRGELVWKLPRKDRLYVAGAVDGHAIVVGRRSIESLDMATGKVAWHCQLGQEHGTPSGRGVLSLRRFFLPVDTPEVLEIDLADGRLAARSAARGNAVPGNLLAYRGEVISQGVDSLDVFHQSAALDARIETAFKADPRNAWATLWRGQLDLDRGDIAAGVAKVRAAHAAQPSRVPAGMVADALRFAIERDFAQASGLWREAVALSGSPQDAAATLRTTVDGFLGLGDMSRAWEPLQALLAQAGLDATATGGSDAVSTVLVADGADPQLTVTPQRWLQGRLADLFAKAPPQVRAELDQYAASAAQAALAHPAGSRDGDDGRESRREKLRECIDLFGRHETALRCRRHLAESLAEAIEASSPGDERRDMMIAREFLLMELAHSGLPADRDDAAAAIDALRPGSALPAEDGATAEWPIGRVVQRRGSGLRVSVNVGSRPDAGQELRFMRSRLMNIPVANGPDSFLPGLELAFDLHQQSGIVATDGYGRQLGEPFGTKPRPDAGRPVPLFQPGGMDEASVLGRVVFVRAGGSIAAFDVSGQPKGGTPPAVAAGQGGGRNRSLWVVTDSSETSAEARAAGFVMNVAAGRGARDGSLPLGARVSEPRPTDDDSRRGGVRGGSARCTGVPLLADRSLRLYDPRTGELIWERQRVPVASELIGDDDVLVVCPPDGRQAVVLSMADGRMLRTLDIPPAEQRLLTSGRRIVAVQPAESGANEAWARRVRVEVFDPLSGGRQVLGDYPGESRAAEAGPGRLAIVEPSGDITLLDAEGQRVVFRTRLPHMPAGLQQVQVMPWRDRLMVLVGRANTPEDQRQLERIGAVGPLPGMPGRELPQLLAGSIWAVGRDSGDMLWPVPATILHHSLQRHQASELPVMLFARSIQPAREPDRPRLSLLCIDKRTGQAVYVDDRFSGRSPSRPDTLMLGCSISGDPATHMISLSQGGREGPDLQLEYTGQPAAPRPPFQASSSPVPRADSLFDLEFWINKAIKLPLPF